MTDYANDERFPGPDPYAPLRQVPSFPLHSNDFARGGRIPEIHTAPSNQSPHLQWSDLPAETRSIAVTCFDPDAPTASGYWHWAVFNLPPTVLELPTGAGQADTPLLGLTQTTTLGCDSGVFGYYGPRPPAGHGPHRYLFAVHALDVEHLDLPASTPAAVLGFHLNFHSVARSIYWGWYETTGEH